MYDKSSRFDSPPAIHVTGAGRAAVAPDLARVVFGVETDQNATVPARLQQQVDPSGASIKFLSFAVPG